MGDVSIGGDASAGPLADLAIATQGGDAFLSRIKALYDAKAASEEAAQKAQDALAGLNLGQGVAEAKKATGEALLKANEKLRTAEASAADIRFKAEADADKVRRGANDYKVELYKEAELDRAETKRLRAEAEEALAEATKQRGAAEYERKKAETTQKALQNGLRDATKKAKDAEERANTLSSALAEKIKRITAIVGE